jgi:hypothetical protein
MHKLILTTLLSALCSLAGAQDVSFYTDSGSNSCDTNFTMPADPTGAVPGTYSETVACPYFYQQANGQQPGLSQLTIGSQNYVQGTRVQRHFVSHIVTTPVLYTVTPVYVFTANFDANGGLVYATNGAAFAAGSPVQTDANGNTLDQDGNIVVSCANVVAGSSYFYQGCTSGYIGNVVDSAHVAQTPLYSSPVAAVDTSGLLVSFTCTTRNAALPTSYKDRVIDTCTLVTTQTDGTTTAGALLPPSEYWIVLPLDTSCSSLAFVAGKPVACSGRNPDGTFVGTSGGAPVSTHSAFGAPPAAPPPSDD